MDEKYIQEMLSKYPLMDETEDDKRDYKLDNVVGLSKKENLPSKYQIRYDYIPYKPKQKNIGGCAACTATAAMMVQLYTDKKLSWMFAYANRRESDYQGKGAYVRELLSNIKDSGITLLDLFNVMKDYPEIHDILINDPNKDAIFAEAAKNKITGYIRISEDEVNSMLAQDIPVFVGVRVYDSFYTTINNNYIIPNAAGYKRGAHEMLLLGYNDETKLRTVLNWWDGEWDHELLLPYDSDIVTDYFIITDKPVIKPEVKKYTVGWNKDSKGWWYSPDGMTYYAGDWKQINGNWFRFDSEGYAYQNCWFKYSKDGKWYYFDDNCYMVYDKWILDNNKWYRLGSDGAMLIGWFQDTDGLWYYLDIDKGYMYSNCRILIDGKYYSFNIHGAWVKDGTTISDDLVNNAKEFEGYYSSWYYGDGTATIGYGTSTAGSVGKRLYNQNIKSCTREQAFEWFKEEMENGCQVLTNWLNENNISLSQNQFDACADVLYNMGFKNFKKFGIADIVLGNKASTWDNWKVCITDINGKEYPGLITRRWSEYKIFNDGDYSVRP